MLPDQILLCKTNGKIEKMSCKNKKFKISVPAYNQNSTSRITIYIRYSKLFWIYLKKKKEKINNPSIRMHVTKIENRITFVIKKYYLEVLTSEKIKLLGSTEKKINKVKNGENVSHLKITWSRISFMWNYQQWLSMWYKSLAYICFK